MKIFKRILATGALLLSIGETAYPEPVELDSRAIAVERLAGVSAAMNALGEFFSEENEKNVLFFSVGDIDGEYIYRGNVVTADQLRDQLFELRDQAGVQSALIVFTIFMAENDDARESGAKFNARADEFGDMMNTIFGEVRIFFIDGKIKCEE